MQKKEEWGGGGGQKLDQNFRILPGALKKVV